ncbi:tetraspanin-3-like [Myxocyprinus asiaticus]|uniref:tetraspanin-3-like n=1 Tax=Myxocyprinus asiaticus TaxID=70543 RepID=UPI002221362A|nr:tetraspanin-3-like [Myxocyprinus asiaticus]
MVLTRRAFKFSLKIASLFLWLVGMCIGVSGAFLLLKYKTNGVFFSSFFISLPALLAVVSGVILLGSAAIGCAVSYKEPSCLQSLFVYFLIIVCCIVGTAAALAYTHTGKLDVDLAPLKDVFQSYNGNSKDPDTKAVNSLQDELQCCGVKNYTDWIDTPWFNHSGKYNVPQSCCNKNFHSCNGTLDLPSLLYTEGCQIKFEEELLLVLHIIIITSFVIIFVLVMSWISVAPLMRYPPPQEYRMLDQD